jgi:hypothetical protein
MIIIYPIIPAYPLERIELALSQGEILYLVVIVRELF